MTKSKEIILQESKEQAISLNPQFNFERERMFIGQIVANDKYGKLKLCTPGSVYGSIITAAELGVSFNPERGHATLVPYGKSAKLTLMYTGMAHIASRELGVRDIDAGVVYSNDKIEITLGTNGSVSHSPEIIAERGKLVGAWAYAKFPDGSTKVAWVSADDLRAMQEKSKMPGAWKMWPDSMRRAKALRRLLKTVIELQPGSKIEKVLEQNDQFDDFEEVQEEAKQAQNVAPEFDMTNPKPIPDEVQPEKNDQQSGDADEDEGADEEVPF